MSAEGWAALAAVVGVLVAIGVPVTESRQSRFSQEIGIMSQLDARFETPEFRSFRRGAATWLLAGRPESDVVGHDATRALLNFFETLAYLHRRGAVSTESVWHYFGTWLMPYHEACKPYVRERQQEDPNCFAEVSALYDAVFQCEREKRNYHRTEQVVSPTAVAALLHEESCLPATAGLLPPA